VKEKTNRCTAKLFFTEGREGREWAGAVHVTLSGEQNFYNLLTPQ